jgi:hypothetical protein
MTPYRWGDRQCKFSARPVDQPSPFIDTASPNFLRENMARHLAGSAAVFELMAQLRSRPDQMPIEDPTVEWSEQAAPFVPVARITIPSQMFDTDARRRFEENLSFTPWHCVDALRPLGGINRVRATVYRTISRLRHEMNGVVEKEPTNFET